MFLDASIVESWVGVLNLTIGRFPVWQVVAITLAATSMVEGTKICIEVGSLYIKWMKKWRKSRIWASSVRFMAVCFGALFSVLWFGLFAESFIVGLAAGASSEVVYRYVVKPIERRKNGSDRASKD